MKTEQERQADTARGLTLVIIAPDGTELKRVAGIGQYIFAALSPDGERTTVDVQAVPAAAAWLLELARAQAVVMPIIGMAQRAAAEAERGRIIPATGIPTMPLNGRPRITI